MSAVNVDTGEFDTFTQDNITLEEAPSAALSSSSIPGWFQPRPFKGNLYMDGGTVYNTNANNGVQGCLDAGYAEEDIVMDIAICGETSPGEIEKASKNAFYNYGRSHHLTKAHLSSNSVDATRKAYPSVNYRYLFVE